MNQHRFLSFSMACDAPCCLINPSLKYAATIAALPLHFATTNALDVFIRPAGIAAIAIPCSSSASKTLPASVIACSNSGKIMSFDTIVSTTVFASIFSLSSVARISSPCLSRAEDMIFRISLFPIGSCRLLHGLFFVIDVLHNVDQLFLIFLVRRNFNHGSIF